MLVCAIDIALVCSGLAVLRENKELLHTELIKTPPKKPYLQKICHLYDTLFQTYKTLQARFGEPLHLVIEGRLEGGFSSHTLASLEGARIAAILAYLNATGRENLTRISVYSPARVKEFVTGKRAATKEQMALAFAARWGDVYRVEQHDLIDAVCLGLVFLSERGFV